MDDKTKADIINRKASDFLMNGDASIPKPREATDPDEIARLRAERLPQLIKYASDLVRLLTLPRPEYKSERNQLKRDRITARQDLEDELEYYAHPTIPYTMWDYIEERDAPGYKKRLVGAWLSSDCNSMLTPMPENITEEEPQEGPQEDEH
jgi:hypothetical protein